MTTPTPPAATSPATAKLRRAGANLLTYAFLLAGALLMLGPFVFSVMTSLKTPKQFNTSLPLTLPDPVTTENYVSLFGERYNFIVPIAVTVQVVLVLVIGQMVSSILAAYAFARLEFRGRDTIFWLYIATLMIPAVVTIIPLFSMMTAWDLKNTFWGLVLPFMFGSPYAIFLLRENFRSTPSEILDAAEIDGAGILRRLWQIMVPMNRPLLATLLLHPVGGRSRRRELWRGHPAAAVAGHAADAPAHPRDPAAHHRGDPVEQLHVAAHHRPEGGVERHHGGDRLAAVAVHRQLDPGD